jgi:hypothetical protein
MSVTNNYFKRPFVMVVIVVAATAAAVEFVVLT